MERRVTAVVLDARTAAVREQRPRVARGPAGSGVVQRGPDAGVGSGPEFEQHQHLAPSRIAEAYLSPRRPGGGAGLRSRTPGRFSSVEKAGASLHPFAANPRSGSSTIRGWENGFLRWTPAGRRM